MTGRFQFSLRRLMWWVTATALVLGVISWLAPETQRALGYFVQVFALLFGLFISVVLAIAVVQFSLKMLRWLMVVASTTLKRR